MTWGVGMGLEPSTNWGCTDRAKQCSVHWDRALRSPGTFILGDAHVAARSHGQPGSELNLAFRFDLQMPATRGSAILNALVSVHDLQGRHRGFPWRSVPNKAGAELPQNPCCPLPKAPRAFQEEEGNIQSLSKLQRGLCYFKRLSLPLSPFDFVT